jgi:Tol biopolymer transport system component/polyisoprenoid-binding protein YceI
MAGIGVPVTVLNTTAVADRGRQRCKEDSEMTHWKKLLAMTLYMMLTAACGVGNSPNPVQPAQTLQPTVVAVAAPVTTGLRTFHIVPEQSEASYRVQEKFLERPLPITAVGRTNVVSGTFELNLDGQPSGRVITMTVDLRTIRSDAEPRDYAMREWLAVNHYPFATFTSTAIEDAPALVRPGEEVTFQVAGDLTVRGRTLPVTFDMTATLVDDILAGSAKTIVSLDAYQIPAKRSWGLSVDDAVTVQFDFVAAAEGAPAPAVVAAPSPMPAPLIAAPAPSSGTLARQDLIAFISQRDGNDEIYVMNQDGTAQTRLTQSAAFEGSVVWSPAGNKLAFVASEGRFEGTADIYVVNPDGTDLTNLTAGGRSNWMPAWSPDGTQLVFVSDRNGVPDIYVMNADGAAVTQLTKDAQAQGWPVWSPDGKQIAYVAGMEHFSLYVMNADGANRTQLLRRSTFADLPVWSPDGTQIAYVDGGFNPEIYTVTAAGGDPTKMTDASTYDGYPSWSPDGQQIAFRSYRDGNWEIYVMQADGSSQTNITNHPAEDESPAWSPDGQHLVFTSNRSGTYQLYVLDVAAALQGDATLAATQLTDDPVGAGAAVWQPRTAN